MQITINGQPERIEPGTIEEMVRRRGLVPEHLVVEYNREVLPRDRWPRVTLREGDVVELLRFVGGG